MGATTCLGLFKMRCYHGIGYNTDGFFCCCCCWSLLGAHASQNNNYYEQCDLDSCVSGKKRIEKIIDTKQMSYFQLLINITWFYLWYHHNLSFLHSFLFEASSLEILEWTSLSLKHLIITCSLELWAKKTPCSREENKHHSMEIVCICLRDHNIHLLHGGVPRRGMSKEQRFIK